APAEAEAAVGVGDDGNVGGALPGRELGEVRDPQAIGPVDGEVALDEIGRERMLLRPRRRAFALLRVDRDKPRLAHQPRDPLLPDLQTAAELQLLEDPPRAVGLLALGEDHADLLGQEPVGERTVGERLALPVVVAGAGDAERPAQAGDGLASALFVDQPVERHRRSVSRAKKVTARFKISRSCSSSRTWRRSLRSSSRSSVVSPSSRSAAIELLLLAPKPQRLAADAELGGDLRNRAAARLEQTDRLTPELRRVRPRVPRGHFASPSSPDEG